MAVGIFQTASQAFFKLLCVLCTALQVGTFGHRISTTTATIRTLFVCQRTAAMRVGNNARSEVESNQGSDVGRGRGEANKTKTNVFLGGVLKIGDNCPRKVSASTKKCFWCESGTTPFRCGLEQFSSLSTCLGLRATMSTKRTPFLSPGTIAPVCSTRSCIKPPRESGWACIWHSNQFSVFCNLLMTLSDTHANLEAT